MDLDLVEKYAAPVPRYTSYPTSPHFSQSVDNATYVEWLKALQDGQSLSLYVHIPYCDRLCWFCACHTKHTLKYEPVASYLVALKAEIAAVARMIRGDVKVKALHFGGGSPTMLAAEDMIDLAGFIRERFAFADNAEISVEMDPNDLDEARFDALAAIGTTRASLGVQDFDPQVQKAINRIQTFEQTRHVVESVRRRGVTSVNCDILYGLPFQTAQSHRETVDAILSLDPDRIALFGYAHVPWMKKHQTMIAESSLPDVRGRYVQMQEAADYLTSHGYDAIGIDHFAKPGDSLAIAARQGRLARNFQGYTDDCADALIGFGASSIGKMPQGYVQNMVSTSEYKRMALEDGTAVIRGKAFSAEDLLRGHVIERLMCDFKLDFVDLRARFGAAAEPVVLGAKLLVAGDVDGLVQISGDCLIINPKAKPLSRTIASAFDSYFMSGKARHSIAV